MLVVFKQQTVHHKQYRKDRRGRFSQDGDRRWNNIEIITAQMREGQVNGKRRDDAEGRDHFRRCDDVVDRVRVGRMQPVPRRGGERDPTVGR